MSIKVFFRPSKKKILLFIAILLVVWFVSRIPGDNIFSIIFFVSPSLPAVFLLDLFYHSPVHTLVMNIVFLVWIALFYYIVVCLISFIYHKIRR